MRFPLCVLFSSLLALPAEVGPVATLPVEVQGSALYVSVRVSGSRPLSLQWDSAAGWHAINLRAAQEANLPTREHPSGAEGAGDGRTRAFAIQRATLLLGGREVSFMPATAIDLDPVSLRRGRVLDGLLGAPLLKRYVVVTDPDRGVMEFYEPEGWKYTGKGEEIPVRADENGVPHVRVRFSLGRGAPLEGEFKIDSAASGSTIALAGPFTAAHGLLEKLRAQGASPLADEIAGVGGTSRMWYARIGSIQLGSTVFPRPVIGLTEATGGTLGRKDLAGIIGGGLMHRMKVTYDIGRGRIFIEPGKTINDPFEEDMSGLRWALAAISRSEFRVRAVMPDSPAARAGFQPGDVFVSLDGKPAAAFDIIALRRRLREHGKSVRFVIRRNGSDQEIALQLERRL